MSNSTLRSLFSAALLTLALGTAACGDDPVDPPAEGLTAEEAGALLDALGALFATDVQTLQGLLVIQNAPCPLGGVAAASGTVVPSDDGLSATWDLTLVPVQCAVGDGVTIFTLDGNPDIKYAGSMATDLGTGQVTVAATVNGTASWQLDDRSGDCTASLTLEATAALDGSGSSITSGTLCGHQVTAQTTLPS